MAVIKKTLFPKNLSNYSVLVNDTEPNSRYFKISELSDTFTGGKNAFLIAGSEELVPDTKIQIELKDSAGNIIYHEPGEGLISSSINGESFVTEYYEGVSKVVAVYIYPDTAYGPCTLTILGELNQYVDENNIIRSVPIEWENKYNVKWETQINVNPSLPNTTKIRFYQRPLATISEILSPIYRIDNGIKVNSGVSQSFADIKLSRLETFAGDVKRVKVFRTSQGDISDYDLIQDILVESKELLTSYNLSGSVVGQTGIFTSETLKNFWNTGSLNVYLTSSRVESGVALNGSGNFRYTSSLDIKSTNTYELNFDAFYSSSTSSNLGIYLVSGSVSSSIGTLYGTQPTKNLLDTIIPFKINTDYPTASLYFSQSQGEWHLGNISLKLSQDTAFSPDEISFITTMPTIIGDEDYNFKFEFYDVNNNYVPVAVTQSANFTGGNTGKLLRSLTFDSDRTAFRFSTGSIGNPPFQQVGFKITKTNLTGSVTYGRSVYDTSGNYIAPASYAGTYPGTLTNSSDAGATLTIANFSGSLTSTIVGSIVYTASCDGLEQYETIYRFEDGDNAPGVFVTANTNQFIYKATDLSLNPNGQVITIEAKRKNLASATTTLTVNSGSGKPALTYVSTNGTTGVDTYTLAGSSYSYSTGETIYYISGSDQFGNEFSDSIKVSPVKILDGFSVAVTNENTSFPATSTGTVVGGFAASSGSITVKVGNENISYASPIANNKFSASISSTSGLTANTFNGTNYSISALSADSGSLTLLVKYQDGGGTIISSSKEITYSKVKKAAPILTISTTNKAQSVTAKSTGAQIDAFANATVTVSELYNGSTNNLTITTLTATSSDIASISTTAASGLVTLNGKTLADGTNSTTVSISAIVTDSEGTSRTLTDTITLSKVKKAVPNVEVSVSPQAQSVTANADGSSPATPTSLTVKALEGGTTRLTSVTATGTSVTIGTITNDGASSPYNFSTIPLSAVAADNASVAITVNYTDSEGTAGTKTTTATISKAKKGTNGNDGAPGANGADGGVGPGVVYRGDWAANTIYYSSSIRVDVVKGSDGGYYYAKQQHTSTNTSPYTDKPITGATYTTYWNSFGATFSSVATDILLAQDATITRGLVMGTYGATDKGFIRSANASALMTGKGYYLDTTGSMRFGDPAGAYIKFTESEGLIINGNVVIDGGATIGGTTLTVVKSGAASGATAQQNNSAKTDGSVGGWSVDNDNIWRGTKGTDDTYTTNNGDITFGAGWISAKQFKIASNGNASFKGNLTGASGTFSDTVSGATITGGTISIGSSNNIFKADSNGIYLGNATFASAPFRVSMAGAVNASNISVTGGSITIGANFSVNSSGVMTASSAVLSGAITAGNGSSIGGWTISNSQIYVPNAITLDAVAKQISLNDSSGTPRVFLNTSDNLSNLTGGPAGSGTLTRTNVGSSITNNTFYTETITSFVATSGYTTTVVADANNNNSQTHYSIYAPSPGTIYDRGEWEIFLEKGSNGAQTTIIQYTETNGGATSPTRTFPITTDDISNSANIVGDGDTWYIKYRAKVSWGSGTISSVYRPEVAWSYAASVSKTEIVPGGIQVAFNTGRYLKVPRTSTGTFVQIGGDLTATGTKTFRITHPLDENKWLYHTAIEGPRVDNLYRGYVELTNGKAIIDLDEISNMTKGTWEALNRDGQFFLQNMTGWDRVKGFISGSILNIECENQSSSDNISYMVIAERQDEEIKNTYGTDETGRLITERIKEDI